MWWTSAFPASVFSNRFPISSAPAISPRSARRRTSTSGTIFSEIGEDAAVTIRRGGVSFGRGSRDGDNGGFGFGESLTTEFLFRR